MDARNQAYKQLEYEIRHQNLDCADNLRVALLSDRSDVNNFYEYADKGCCGFYEEIITINGERWIIGCNYGH